MFEEYNLIKKAENGDVESQNRLSVFYSTGDIEKVDNKKALYWCKKAADQGDVDAENRLGWMYYHGQKGITRDYKSAAYWWRRAADQGHEDAPYNLGVLLRMI